MTVGLGRPGVGEQMGSDYRSIGTLLAAAAIGVAGQLAFALTATSGPAGVFATCLLVGVASMVVGGLIGFLFGIPRSLQRDEPPPVAGGTAPVDGRLGRSAYGANTNLEQVSDWLTKIIVGVGLTQLANAREAFSDLGTALAPALGGGPAAGTVGVASVIFFWTVGFLLAYVWTRINFGRALAQADQLQEAVDQAVTSAMAETTDGNRRLQVLVDRQLSASADPVDPAALLAAVKGVTADRRVELFTSTNKLRGDTWKAAATKPVMERTEPIFRALVDSGLDPTMAHRYHATLGYVLKDRRVPDLEGAERLLTEAIDLRDTSHEEGWAVYELNRALVRILLGRPDADVTADLRAARSDPSTLAKLTTPDADPAAAKTVVDAWLAPRGLTLEGL